MKTLLSTTALVMMLGFPTLALAQTTTAAVDKTTTERAATAPGFLATRGHSDVFASDLIGHDVHARRGSVGMTKSDGKAHMNADGTRRMDKMNRADLDDMDNIGQINEIVLSSDGQVRALVIGVGGFLGMGDRDVAITMDQVTFASDAENGSDMFIIVNTDKNVLKDSPAYDRTSMTTDDAAGNAESGADKAAFQAPDISRDGYDRVKATDVSTDLLMGKSVYDSSDKDVGTVTDMIIDDAGNITAVIIDFGGLLGIGKSQVSMDYDELTIISTEGLSDVRVYVDATKEQIQGRPLYQARN